MYNFSENRHRRLWLVLAALTAAAVAYAAAPDIARAEQADSSSGSPSAGQTAGQQSAAEMLQDGLDAVAESQSTLATQLFEQLILSFPGTPQALRAEHELSALPAAVNPPDAGDGRSSAFQQERETDASLKLKFAKDAGDRVFFAENSAVIGGRARALIEHQARWLAQRTDVTITLIGRADDGASAEASRELSAKRAEAVRDRLVAAGIAAERLIVDARGVRDPIATCHSALCQAQNRHVETAIGASASGRADGGQNRPESNGAACDRLRKQRCIGAWRHGLTLTSAWDRWMPCG